MSAGRCEGGAYGPCPVIIVVVILFKCVGEKEEPEHKEDYGQLYDYQYPELPADGHFTKSADVQVGHPAEKAAGMCIIGRIGIVVWHECGGEDG